MAYTGFGTTFRPSQRIRQEWFLGGLLWSMVVNTLGPPKSRQMSLESLLKEKSNLTRSFYYIGKTSVRAQSGVARMYRRGTPLAPHEPIAPASRPSTAHRHRKSAQNGHFWHFLTIKRLLFGVNGGRQAQTLFCYRPIGQLLLCNFAPNPTG